MNSLAVDLTKSLLGVLSKPEHREASSEVLRLGREFLQKFSAGDLSFDPDQNMYQIVEPAETRGLGSDTNMATKQAANVAKVILEKHGLKEASIQEVTQRLSSDNILEVEYGNSHVEMCLQMGVNFLQRVANLAGISDWTIEV
ncbi:MAG: hypothetical protein OXU45_05010 [Candidatus Melainabacteria bacterium]|nr:hypothetical protein [Candidatus Melainabacteria bacterium]